MSYPSVLMSLSVAVVVVVVVIVVVAVVVFNTCRAPHFQMSPKRFTMATIALFSASEKTNSALIG